MQGSALFSGRPGGDADCGEGVIKRLLKECGILPGSFFGFMGKEEPAEKTHGTGKDCYK